MAAASWVRLIRAVKSEILLQLAFPGIVAHNPGKGSSGGGRLLGRQHQAKNLQQNKADRVVGAGKKSFHKQRETLLHDPHLEGRGEHRQQSAAYRGKPHLPILPARMGNVVFAAAAGALHRLTRQKVQVLLEQGRNSFVFQAPFDELVKQVTCRRQAVADPRHRHQAEA